jgi:hypothetical protein
MTRYVETLLTQVVENSLDTLSEDKYLVETDSLVTPSAMFVELGSGQLDEERIQEEIHPASFAGCRVFEVDADTFTRCRLGKRKYARYEEYVGNGSVGDAIREYGRSRHGKKGIILVNSTTGAMLYLRYPGKYYPLTR